MLAQATKNEAELAGMREAHLRDAEAICDFLAWIEKEVRQMHDDPARPLGTCSVASANHKRRRTMERRDCSCAARFDVNHDS